jgi:hypothetical protein
VRSSDRARSFNRLTWLGALAGNSSAICRRLDCDDAAYRGAGLTAFGRRRGSGRSFACVGRDRAGSGSHRCAKLAVRARRDKWWRIHRSGSLPRFSPARLSHAEENLDLIIYDYDFVMYPHRRAKLLGEGSEVCMTRSQRYDGGQMDCAGRQIARMACNFVRCLDCESEFACPPVIC